MTQPLPDFAAARRAMIDSQLRPQGVADPAVLAAMGKVPREDFVPEAVRPLRLFRPPARPRQRPGDDRAGAGSLVAALEPRSGERALGGRFGQWLCRRRARSARPAGRFRRRRQCIEQGHLRRHPDRWRGRRGPGRACRFAWPNGRLATGVDDNGVTRLAVGRVSGGVLGCAVLLIPKCRSWPVSPVRGFSHFDDGVLVEASPSHRRAGRVLPRPDRFRGYFA